MIRRKITGGYADGDTGRNADGNTGRNADGSDVGNREAGTGGDGCSHDRYRNGECGNYREQKRFHRASGVGTVSVSVMAAAAAALVGRFIKSVENRPEMINAFDEVLRGSLVEKVTVYSKDKIVFTMTGGMEMEA